MVDKPPFVDFHSLLNKVTFTVLLEPEVGVSSSRPSCDVEAMLQKADSYTQKIQKLSDAAATLSSKPGLNLSVLNFPNRYFSLLKDAALTIILSIIIVCLILFLVYMIARFICFPMLTAGQ